MLMSRQHLNFIVAVQYRLQSRRKWKTLRAQVAEGELIPVETSEWAAQIVVVHKRDGGICIYGNFKLTVNPVICPQVYPLPTPEEIFSTLANGESFIFQTRFNSGVQADEGKREQPTPVNN